jgi:hypothetical protein
VCIVSRKEPDTIAKQGKVQTGGISGRTASHEKRVCICLNVESTLRTEPGLAFVYTTEYHREFAIMCCATPKLTACMLSIRDRSRRHPGACVKTLIRPPKARYALQLCREVVFVASVCVWAAGIWCVCVVAHSKTISVGKVLESLVAHLSLLHWMVMQL